MKYLRGMSGYPPASHAIAASIGWLLGSSLQAIFVTGALFTFGIYVILGLLMQRGAEKGIFRCGRSINGADPGILLLAISLPTWFLARHRYDKADGRFALTCLSLGVALAALAQITAYFALGLGSSYAIKKHRFLVGTLLMVAIAQWAARLSALKAFVDWLQAGRTLSGTVPTFAFAGIAMFAVFPWRSTSAAPFLRYDTEARAVMKTGKPDLQGSTLSFNRDFPLGLNLATSIAVLKMDPWGPLGSELFRVFGMAASDPNSSSPASRFVLVRAADVAGKHVDCEVGPQPVSVRLLRSTCFFDK